MYLSEITVWGCLLVLLLLAAAIAIVWLIDQRTLKKMVHLGMHLPQLPGKLWLVVVGAMLAGSVVLAGCLVISLPCRMFFPLLVVLLVCLFVSTPQALLTYWRSLKHTQSHRRYLLANGASHLESVVPSARRALRSALLPLLLQRSSAMPMALLMLFCGLMMGGTTLAAALVITLMTWAAALAASVLAVLLAMWMADRILFDKHENLLEK